jgi:hypothetical protein
LSFDDPPIWKPTEGTVEDVDMLVRAPSRQNWYKAMLKTGIFDLIFRTEEDRLNFEKLPQAQRPFTVLEDAGSSVGARNARNSLSNGQDMGQHEINILYLSKTLNITRVERMLNELGVTEHVQGIRKVMQKTVCKITIGFHVLDYAVATSKALHGKLRVDIHRDPLVMSVNYRVPKGHCYNCFNQKGPRNVEGAHLPTVPSH